MRRFTGALTALLVVLLAVPAAAVDAGGSFIDDDGSIHESAIEAIATAGITQGCDPVGDRYCPASSVTRAEMAAFLARALGQTELFPQTPTFTDVAPTDWYYGWVERLAALGISIGFGDGTFRPERNVTRADMAVFLVRALDEQPVVVPTGVFADVVLTAYYAGHTERIHELGITNGCATSPLRYCPFGAVSRAEMASFVARAFGLVLEPVPPRPSPAGIDLALTTVASGLSSPVFVDAPVGDARLFIVEKGGRIKILSGGQVLANPFLDISSLVSTDGERGLLGMAFHPDYGTNGRFFVHYTNTAGNTRVVEYGVSGDPDVADPTPVDTLLSVTQPYSNHNGGMIAFGPDGKLYVGLGDGGGGGDPLNHGQNLQTTLGTITALDLGTGTSGIFAYGLRNPWRFAWDGDRIYIGDVGQGAREEIDVVSIHQPGANFGWRWMEGSICYVSGCSSAGLALPVVDYTHGDGCSVTGGYVYRGTAIPELAGHYFYGDFCSGFVRSFRYTGAAADQRSWPSLSTGSLASFGTDGSGEMYVVSIVGTVARIDRA